VVAGGAERGKPDWLLHSEAIQVYGAGWPRNGKMKILVSLLPLSEACVSNAIRGEAYDPHQFI
jgi:hypothetical protein